MFPFFVYWLVYVLSIEFIYFSFDCTLTCFMFISCTTLCSTSWTMPPPHHPSNWCRVFPIIPVCTVLFLIRIQASFGSRVWYILQILVQSSQSSQRNLKLRSPVSLSYDFINHLAGLLNLTLWDWLTWSTEWFSSCTEFIGSRFSTALWPLQGKLLLLLLQLAF